MIANTTIAILVIAVGGLAFVAVLVVNFILLHVLRRITGSLVASDLAAARAAIDAAKTAANIASVVDDAQQTVRDARAVSEHARDTVNQVVAMYRTMMELFPAIQSSIASHGVELLAHIRRLEALEHPGAVEESPMSDIEKGAA